ncbi:DUF2884 family protein [Lysobacter sp. D1-1-M9]|uniref:DUF2884 family protein n=2 Tax=Novilysobacter TaxID=3382699 RepID=UPI002FC5C061
MRRLFAIIVLPLVCGVAAAAEIECSIESDYELALNERSVILTRDSGTPQAIVMRGGRLFVDDRWVELSAADSRRIAEFERGARAAMPEAAAIGWEAAEIAFIALGEVAAGFSDDPAVVRSKLAKARAQLDARLARSATATRFDSRDIGEGVAEAVREVVPTLVGDIVGGALSAAFSGDASRLERMEGLDARIEAQVESRAQELGERGERLCSQLAALDAIDEALEVRVDGQPLNMLEAEVGPGHATASTRAAAD